MSLLPTPKYVDKLEKSNAINNDIISTIHKNYPTAVFQTKKIAPTLKGANDFETAKNVWLFLKRKLKYKRDPEGKQMIKLPSRLLQPTDRTADCKSYSLLAASLLANNGLKPTFRYASYKEYEKTPTHVYVTTKDSNGNEIIVDGCYRQFNDQKQYFHKYDYPMEVYTLSGINGPLKKLVKKVAPKAVEKRQAKKAAGNTLLQKTGKKVKKVVKAASSGVKKVVKAAGSGGKKVVQAGKKVYIAAPRIAYLGLVALNVHGFATKLAEGIAKDPQKIKNFWTKLGGNYNELVGAVNKGKTKKAILGVGYIGEPLSIAATLASAAPIIIAAAAILKSIGVNSPAIDKAVDAAKDIVKEPTGEGEGDSSGSGSGESGDNEPTSLFSTKNILIAGGVAAAIIFLPKLLKSKK